MIKYCYLVVMGVVGTALFAEEPKPAPVVPPQVQTPSTPSMAKPVAPPVVPAVGAQAAPAAPAVPALAMPRAAAQVPNPEWTTLLERMRMIPRAGEVRLGTLNTSLTDVFGMNVEGRTKAATIAADYEKELIEKSLKWESEMKELRAAYEAKMVAELPEEKRESARKFLELSRSKGADAAARDAKMRAEFLDRMRFASHVPGSGNAPRVPGAPGAPGVRSTPAGAPANPAVEAPAWMREERMKAVKQDEDAVKELRGVLGADDAVRFDAFNRTHTLTSQTPGMPNRASFPGRNGNVPAGANAPAAVPNYPPGPVAPTTPPPPGTPSVPVTPAAPVTPTAPAVPANPAVGQTPAVKPNDAGPAVTPGK